MKEYQIINLKNNNTENNIQLIPIIRKEHPNCAIYKKNIATASENILRTTLFTPKKRISKDISEDTGRILSNYITAEKHLGTLLFYLKDIIISTNDMNILLADDDSIVIGELSYTPYSEVLGNWIDFNDYDELSSYKDFGRCIHQLKRNLIQEIQCAKTAHEKYDIKYFTFKDTLRVMDSEIFEKHYYEFYRSFARELPECKIVMKISGKLEEYGKMLHRKHLHGVLIDSNPNKTETEN